MRDLLKKSLPPVVIDWYRRFKNYPNIIIFTLTKKSQKPYYCNICGYLGPFMSFRGRANACCPKCLSYERDRLLFYVLQQLATHHDFSKMSLLHFAPENCLRNYLKQHFKVYQTADLLMDHVDFKEDLTKLSFLGGQYDCIIASHVLEHIIEDGRAISEIKRVLKPDGIAILPVPIISEMTIEFYKPISHLDDHVRDCGLDYYDRYRKYFREIEFFDSSQVPATFQTYAGGNHIEYVPVCSR